MDVAPICGICNKRRVSHRGVSQDGYRRWRAHCDTCRRPDNRTARRPDIIAAGGGHCVRCSFVAVHESQLHIDHIVPISCGGDRNDPDNLQILCANCHAYKSAVEDPMLRRSWEQLTFNLIVGPEQAAMFT